jgi:sulfoxide reductase heme-binding subunit YedZ
MSKGAMQRKLAQRMPWCDPAGRFSGLKLATFIALFLPAVWMGVSSTSIEWAFPSPYVPLIYHSGLWATYLLLLGLAITPARRILNWARIGYLRRMIGLAAFAYTLLHVFAWFGLRFWDFRELGTELLARPSLWIALLATLGLTVLAATSLDSAMRRLGPLWKRLHRAVYALTLLAVVHFLMSPGSLQGAPFLMAGVFFWLMGWRLVDRSGAGTRSTALALLGAASVAFTLVLEPLWLATYQHERTALSPLQAVLANFDFEMWAYLGVPPFAWLLLLTLVSAAVPLGRPIYSRWKYAGRLLT